jgi:hypothetical protein
MKVLVCGDRNWKNKDIIRAYLASVPNLELVIEGESRGADTLAREVAEEMQVNVMRFPANWSLYHKAAGAIRNKQMLDEGKPDKVLAFHNNIEQSKGTKHMVALANKYKIPTQVIRECEPCGY